MYYTRCARRGVSAIHAVVIDPFDTIRVDVRLHAA